MKLEGIIIPVEFSNWATPLAYVPKPDGAVRLCGNYQATINQATHTEQFPIPTAEQMRSKLAGGEKYLNCAYLQVLLDAKPKSCVQ